jgi:phosphatidate phosphatase PAH1
MTDIKVGDLIEYYGRKAYVRDITVTTGGKAYYHTTNDVVGDDEVKLALQISPPLKPNTLRQQMEEIYLEEEIEQANKEEADEIESLAEEWNAESGWILTYDESLPEFYDYKKVIEHGEKKHGKSNWLEPNGSKSSFKQMHDSMFHHLAESFAGIRKDEESGLDPLLHLITRAKMLYTRIQRGITHKEDERR